MRNQVGLGDGWEDHKKGGGGKRGRQEEEEAEGEDESVNIQQLKMSAAENRVPVEERFASEFDSR